MRKEIIVALPSLENICSHHMKDICSVKHVFNYNHFIHSNETKGERTVEKIKLNVLHTRKTHLSRTSDWNIASHRIETATK